MQHGLSANGCFCKLQAKLHKHHIHKKTNKLHIEWKCRHKCTACLTSKLFLAFPYSRIFLQICWSFAFCAYFNHNFLHNGHRSAINHYLHIHNTHDTNLDKLPLSQQICYTTATTLMCQTEKDARFFFDKINQQSACNSKLYTITTSTIE